MRRYYLQFGESLMDIKERYCEHFKISSGDAVYSNSAKNINDWNSVSETARWLENLSPLLSKPEFDYIL